MVDDSNTTHVFVGCGASKRDGVCEAREKYTSTYFGLKRDYAENRESWSILSAKFGVIDPEKEIGDYDVTIDDGVTPSEWEQTVSETLDTVSWGDVDVLEVLAGKRYTEPIKETLDHLPCEVKYPFERDDLNGIGDQMSWLKKER